MSEPRIGVLADEADPILQEVLSERKELVWAQPGAVVEAKVDVWLVDARRVDPPVLQRLRDGLEPVLFLVDGQEAASWHRVLRKGLHDVVWTSAHPSEVRARLNGLIARQGAWNDVTSALCREAAHDLRGPLQALTFTVAALQNDDAVAPAFAEDIDALLEATDVAGVMLDGISNLGRRAADVTSEQPVVDLTELVRKATQRPAYGAAVTLESGGEPLGVRAHPDALAGAVADVLRVVWIRAAGGRRVDLQCLRFGQEAVLTASAKAYDALLDNLGALLSRERPILMRRDRVPLPLAGLAFAREVARASGGDLLVRRVDQRLQVEMRLPLA